MRPRDLTRWNRSGLSALTYVDGNAAVYLETIRRILATHFLDRWRLQLEPPFDPAELEAEEPDGDWRRFAEGQHLVEQYLGPRGNIGWELARAFARSCHVLTRHIDAHANGALLRTATEWEDLRKMLAMLGYRPAGATSATTMLAIDARADGRVARGLQVRHRPADGGKAIVFETIEDLDVRVAFNLFRVAGWDRSKATLDTAESASAPSPWRENPRAPIAFGDSTLIVKDAAASDAEAAWVVHREKDRLRLVHEADEWKGWRLGDVSLKSSPRFRRSPWINGAGVRRTPAPHGLSPGSPLAWRLVGEEDPHDWRFALVKRADAFGIELDGVKRAFDRPAGDEAWPEARPTNPAARDIEIRRATRLSGSFVVPSDGSSEAEKHIGELGRFMALNMVDGSILERPTSESSPLYEFNGEGVLEGAAADSSIRNFIEWLFGAVGFAASFPPSPLELVKLGAMLMVKDARIPSTGQLVFEAFLDLFGGGGGDQISPARDAPTPALFRFWGTEVAKQDEVPGPAPARLLYDGFGGELWYLPRRLEGGGKAPSRVDDTDAFTIRNAQDDGWFFFDGPPKGVIPNTWAAARFASDMDRWRAVRILALEAPLQSRDQSLEGPANPWERYEQPSGFAVHLELPSDIAATYSDSERIVPELLELQSDYRAAEGPEGADVNRQPLAGALALEPCPGAELLGRTLLATTGDGESQIVRVASVDGCDVTLEPALGPPFDQGNLTLFGNVARAGHGERQPAALLSVGTAGETGRLLLEEREVATVPDPRMEHGAREDLEVWIAGERWEQVARLDDSRPADAHYAVSTTEDGFVALAFGDGRRGRALPPGTRQVELRYRTGAGQRGALPAGSLEEVVKPHPLVRAVRQPFDAVGGADLESREHMRERAPASLLALDRAVSLRDFEQLAAQHGSISQAAAFYRIGGAGRRDEVVVVATTAQGKTLGAALRADLALYLQRRAVPTVRVSVEEHDPVDVRLKVEIRVDTGRRDSAEVRGAVRSALTERFSAERRAIGKPLLLSEVYAAVEAVPGVENSTCRIGAPAGSDRAVAVNRYQLAAVPDATAVECDVAEYVP